MQLRVILRTFFEAETCPGIKGQVLFAFTYNIQVRVQSNTVYRCII